MINRIILVFAVINVALAKPSIDNTLDSKCINSTKDNEIKINGMVNEIVDFLNLLSVRYEEFDIRSLNLIIDKHYEEEDEKDTILDVTVNYCKDKHGNTENIDNIVTDTDMSQIDVNLKQSLAYFEMPDKVEELFMYLKKKRGTRPFLMYINGNKQLLLP